MERERRKIYGRKKKSIKKRGTEQKKGRRREEGVKNLFLEHCWNKNKCEEMWDYMKKFDIIGLTETWVESGGVEEN